MQTILFLDKFISVFCAYKQKQYIGEKSLDKTQYIVIKLKNRLNDTTYCFHINKTGGNYERDYCY